MAKAKKKSKTRRGRTSTGFDAERLRRGAAAAVLVVGVGALVSGAVLGSSALEARAARAIHAGDAEVDIGWPALGEPASDADGTWLPGSERERLTALANSAAAGGRALDAEPLRETSEALMHTGWFERPPVARRRGDGAIAVEGVWRVPAAVIRHAGSERLVSWDAIPLPLIYGEGESGQMYLTNTAFGPGAAEPGRHAPWPGEDVRAGLDLLRRLKLAGLSAQVAGIDVGGRAADPRLEIVTDQGTRVVWGVGPDQFAPAEMSTEVKLERLRTLLTQTGRIDAGAARVEIFGPVILKSRGRP